ncbi:MAG: hypothetical protein IKM03_04130 [Alistipes sp.]|nr:hypothetical protein [Alistipes sp.]
MLSLVRIQSSRQIEQTAELKSSAVFFVAVALRASPPQTTKKYRPLRVLSAQIGDGWYSLIGGCGAENIYFSKVPRFGFAVRIQSSRQSKRNKKMSKDIFLFFYTSAQVYLKVEGVENKGRFFCPIFAYFLCAVIICSIKLLFLMHD